MYKNFYTHPGTKYVSDQTENMRLVERWKEQSFLSSGHANNYSYHDLRSMTWVSSNVLFYKTVFKNKINNCYLYYSIVYSDIRSLTISIQFFIYTHKIAVHDYTSILYSDRKSNIICKRKLLFTYIKSSISNVLYTVLIKRWADVLKKKKINQKKLQGWNKMLEFYNVIVIKTSEFASFVLEIDITRKNPR